MSNKLIIIILLLVLTLGFFWYKNNTITTKSSSDRVAETEVSDKNDNQVKLVSPQEFAQLAQNSQAFIVDVHVPEQAHIPGTDALIPYNKIKENLSKLPKDKSTPILVYCRSGSMSAAASKEILSLGYTNVYDLDGGTNAYKKQQASVSLWPKKQDLKTVVYGEVASTTFTLTNYTSVPTKVTRVSTSCGCTKASVENKELQPYESTTVKVTFDPAVHKDDSDMGDLTRSIYIETDNPKGSELESIIAATVVK